MTTTEPVTQVDLTAPSDSLTYAEILTPAGIVRVNTNLMDTRTGRPVVVVEVEHKASSGEWDIRWGDHGSRFDVRLVKAGTADAEPLMATHQGRPVDARNNIPEERQ